MPLRSTRTLIAILSGFFRTDLPDLFARLAGETDHDKTGPKGYHKLDARAREIERKTAAR